MFILQVRHSILQLVICPNHGIIGNESCQPREVDSMNKMDGNRNEENVISQPCDTKHIVTVSDLSDFNYKRTLSDNRETKTVVIEGYFNKKEGTALLILEKETFQEEQLKRIFQEENEIENNFFNDIYYSYKYFPKTAFNGIKGTLIYPATEKHIKKYEHQPIHIIHETVELYETVTLPFLKSEQFSLQWVFNILEHKSETDRIIFDDPDPENGFILLPDIKWDGINIETLYILALPYKRGIKSLRDLTQKDLPLLKNIYNKGVKVISDKYSVPASQLRVYLHYQPSFYHLHVHFTQLQYSPGGSGTEKAHLITTVINNLELLSNYYQMSALDFIVRENTSLFLKYEALGLVKCAPKKVLQERVDSEVKLKIKRSGLVLDFNGYSHFVNFKEFTAEPLTVTALKSTKQFLSFRVQAECYFKFENHLPPKSVPPMFGKEKASLLCQCHNPLTSKVVFERILPLPSSDCNFSDMFCHLPADLQQPSTTPRLSDCFYSDNLIVINEEIVTGCTRKGKFLKCKRCLTTIGTSHKNSIKIWICCIQLPFDNSTLSEHFKKLIQKAISNPINLFPKILLECEENETYLSLVIIDKNLVVSSCQENLILKNVEVVKLKYKFHSCCDSDIKLLKEDPFHSLHHIKVHKSMLDYGTKFLISNSKTIPPIFSRVDNECMAYLSL